MIFICVELPVCLLCGVTPPADGVTPPAYGVTPPADGEVC
jgi:hypothetical protein